VRMTAVQAQDIRFLGGYVGALFMGSAKVLGEESLGQGGNGKEGKEGKEGLGDGDTTRFEEGG
jgi:DASH complex subunit Hsk3 like